MKTNNRPAQGALSATLAAVVFGLAVSGCDRKTSAPPTEASVTAQAPAKLTFRLKWLIYSSFATHFVAKEKGYFREAALDVDIQPGGPGMDPIRLVATGADDIGLAGYEQILMAREKGIPVISIAEDYIRSGVGMFALKDSGISKPEDFIGRKVGILPGTDKHTLYMALMNKLKIDRTKIQEVPVGFDLALLLNGAVEVLPGFVSNQPFVAEEKGKPVNIIDPYDYGIRPGGNVYFTSEETLKKKRNELKRFLGAALRGVLEAERMDNGQVVDIVLKYNDKLNRAAEVKIWQATKDILLEKDPRKVGFHSREKWECTAQISKDYGLIATVPNLSECYTDTLVEELHREGVVK